MIIFNPYAANEIWAVSHSGPLPEVIYQLTVFVVISQVEFELGWFWQVMPLAVQENDQVVWSGGRHLPVVLIALMVKLY